MKKQMSTALVVLLIASIVSMALIGSVNAIHVAKISWISDKSLKKYAPPGASYGILISNTTRAFAGTLAGGFLAVFAVNNTVQTYKTDPITAVRVVIDRNSTNYVLFKFTKGWVTYANSSTALAGWEADPTEFDANGWPGTIIFNGISDSIAPGAVYWFWMTFGSGPSSCSYPHALGIYTEDEGTTSKTPETDFNGYLGILINNYLPQIFPGISNGTTVYGHLENHCGNNYFVLNFTANDMASPIHATGISNYTIYFNGPRLDFENKTQNSTRNIATPPNYLSTLAVNGTYRYSAKISTLDPTVNLNVGTNNFTITVANGVGYVTKVFVKFTYVPPPSPLVLTPSTGNAAVSTYVTAKNAKTGLVNSTQEIYGAKTLGTVVTASGYNFGASNALTITVYIPTYSSYFATYHTYRVLVYSGTTNSAGNFSVTFVFPEAPAGVYNVTAQTKAQWCSRWFTVTPEIVYAPDQLTGPALITMTATGFTAKNGTYSWFFIVPDALQGVNTQVDRWWYIDGNGTLQNSLNTYTSSVNERVNTTLNWPFMQTGTYNVEIKEINGTYWNGKTPGWVYTPCFVGGNTISVISSLGLLVTIANETAYIEKGVTMINASLNTLGPKITSISGNVVTMMTTVGQINATLNQLKPVIIGISNNVVTIQTTLGVMNTTLNAINAKITSINWAGLATMSTGFGPLNATVNTINGNVNSVKTNTDKIPGLTMPIYLAIIFSLIAAIAAIVCVIMLLRKVA